MPSRRVRPLFPAIDWRALWAAIRLRRAGGWCERCRRPHGQAIYQLDDGRWWDASAYAWRDGDGRVLHAWPPVADIATIAVTRVALATVRRDHDTDDTGSVALCRRCRTLHSRFGLRPQRWQMLVHRLASPECIASAFGIDHDFVIGPHFLPGKASDRILWR